MTYEASIAGRVGENPSNTLPTRFWSFDDVEERLVEAMELWRRSPDRERGWLHVKAYWPDIRRSGEFRVDASGEVDFPEQEPETRPLPLTRAEVASMMEASDWMRHVPERDRRLVALVLVYKVQGKQPQWLKLKRRLGVAFGADGLRKRYSRAVSDVCKALNEAEKLKDGASR